ncbi:MAG: methyltransferase type 11 [Betaproteobacteria bacterium]|nr:methyltransferase type 11 [Betaproteobacteria bacterium]
MPANITFQPFASGDQNAKGQRISSIDPRLSRTNYFDGRLLKASDLIRDQIYLDERALEIGQILGSGIARGLEVTLNHSTLSVSPGMAIAPSGRVLQLADRSLEVNLGNSALIASLNAGAQRRFNRGLYLVALHYAEVGSDAAEAYPADLESKRQFQFNSFAEGVELVLVPLATPLNTGDALAARAGLVSAFMNGAPRPELSEEAVALGLLAVQNGQPLWLDRGLVRRPLRPAGQPGGLQRDLAAHYQELLAEVLELRNEGGLSGGFAADQYFHVLPPVGRLPKSAADPERGAQTFFPRGYEVSIAPVRRDDLPALLEESMRLAPMDLKRDADADIMILVAVSDEDYAWRGRALMKGGVKSSADGLNSLLHIDGLALRLRATIPAGHALDTDATLWKSIWDTAEEGDVFYVRRPPRAAETNVSAVVLASGFALPDPLKDRPDIPAKLKKELDQAIKRVDELEALGLGGDAALSAANAKAETLTQQLEQAKVQVAGLQAAASVSATSLTVEKGRSAGLQKELDNARLQVSQLQTAGGSVGMELEGAMTRIAALTQDLATANKALNDAKAAATKSASDLTAANAKVTGLTQDLNTAKAAVTKAEADRDAAGSKSAGLDLELVAARKTITALQSAATGAAVSATLQKQIDALALERDTAKKSLADLQIRSDADKASLVKLNTDLGAATKSLTDLRATSETDKASLVKLNADLGLAAKSLTDLKAASDTDKASLTQVRAELATTKTSLTSLQRTSTASITKLTSERDTAKKTVTDHETTIAKLNLDLTKIRPQ